MPSPEPTRNRPILPALPARPSQVNISRPILPRRPRVGVSIACEPCRRRKTRCNGSRPRCAGCVRNDMTCTYTLPMKDYQLRQEIVNMQTEHEASLSLIELLRLRSADEANVILGLLRQGTSIHSILRQVEHGDMLCDLSHETGGESSRP